MSRVTVALWMLRITWLVLPVAMVPCAADALADRSQAISWVAASGIAHPSTGTVAGKLAKARVATDTVVHVILNK